MLCAASLFSVAVCASQVATQAFHFAPNLALIAPSQRWHILTNTAQGVVPAGSRLYSSGSAVGDGEAGTDKADAEGPFPSSSPSSFENFDYNAHWYPVSWARDIPYDKPTKVALFDVDYVISRRRYTGETPPTRIPGANCDDDEEVIAVLDRCPHKSASLSEGRVSSCGTRFQCAYHGWTFDGKSGKCLEIPQVVASEGGDVHVGGSSATNRADTTAVPALIQQGMIWLFPCGNLEEALLAPLPPRVPELDMAGYRMIPQLRDFPVDWAILLENIMDADHGLFAHQATPFDLYSASKERPQSIEEDITHGGKGWTIRASVDAVDKLIKYDAKVRAESNGSKKRGKVKNSKGKKEANSDEGKPLRATSTFYAPTHVVLARKNDDGSVSSQTVFWVCPTGTGRSRFMATLVAKAPFGLPRWLVHVFLNNFLDQDTHLLVSTQKYILEAEAKALAKNRRVNGNKSTSGNARRNLFVYRSPTEKLQARLCAFFDKTLFRAPNREEALCNLESASIQPTPTREFSLDRYEQHTRVCPDSADTVRNCDRIMNLCKYGSVLLGAAKLFISTQANPSKWVSRMNSVLEPRIMALFFSVAAVSSFFAKTIKKGFFFTYPEGRRDKDLAKIPDLWRDPR